MSEKNEHIDKLFSDKLKQAEVSPPPGLWNDIEASLDLQIVKRRLIPIWMRYTAAAAVVALFVISGILYLDTTPEIEPTEQSIIKVDSVTEQPEVKEIKQEETESTIIEEIEEPIKETYIAKVEGILTERKPQKESRILNIARSIAGLYDVSVIKLNRIIFDLPVLASVPR